MSDVIIEVFKDLLYLGKIDKHYLRNLLDGEKITLEEYLKICEQ